MIVIKQISNLSNLVATHFEIQKVDPIIVKILIQEAIFFIHKPLIMSLPETGIGPALDVTIIPVLDMTFLPKSAHILVIFSPFSFQAQR